MLVRKWEAAYYDVLVNSSDDTSLGSRKRDCQTKFFTSNGSQIVEKVGVMFESLTVYGVESMVAKSLWQQASY